MGYEYVTTDCGWTIPTRTANGTLTWNATLFPDGFPAMGAFIHSLGLKFGVYSDGGIQMCMTGGVNQTGSLFHEQTDADTFSAWGADLLKYDNCYSDAAAGYPDADYTPDVSPEPRMANMSAAVNATGRDILFQICEWGVDFPSVWAPPLGNTWRVTNDIIPAWRTIFRILNQIVSQTSFAGPGHWLDLDMLEVGNNIFTIPEEQTHFSLWAIAKSPLVIGAALKDTFGSINPGSLAIYKNLDVIGYNQDSLGVAANLTRRYSEAGLDVWAGPLSDGRTVAAMINWNDGAVQAMMNLPDVGLQSAVNVKNVWANTSSTNALTSYTRTIPAHGTMLLELNNTAPAGQYAAELFSHQNNDSIIFSNVYGITSSSTYTLSIDFEPQPEPSDPVTVSTSASSDPVMISMNEDKTTGTATIALAAGNQNVITIKSESSVSSINITPPEGAFYPATSFDVLGSADHVACDPGLCAPVGSKIGNISPNGSASINIMRDTSSASNGPRYVEITYINNDVALSTSWTTGSNSRNITVQVNDAAPVRLEVPLSGRSSELYSSMKGWGDPATLGVLIDGWGTGNGNDTIIVSNANGDVGVQPYGADFVGLRVL